MNKKFLFKLVWRGWFVGVTSIFTPLVILAVLFSPEPPREMLFSVLLIPLIAGLQGAIAGGLVLLGLTIWPLKKGENPGRSQIGSDGGTYRQQVEALRCCDDK